MTTFTITTPVNIDSLAAKAGSDVYNINGGYLTVDQHTRFGTNQNTSAAMGNITLSATLGGTIEFNSTLVRLIAYDTGSGNVPALGTTISRGGGSGILLGVYASLAVAPTTAGSAMPASGFILIRQWNSVAFTVGALTGIGASSTAVDRAGWLEIVGVDARAATCNRLGTFKVRGDWFELGTTDGTRATTYQIPSNGAIVYLPGVWVETGTATDVYEFYPCAGSTTALAANIATDEVRGRWCWISTAGLLRFGHDGTNSTGGFIPESGRRIRIPNIFFMCCTAAAPTVNVLPDATLGTRYEFATTGGGVLDIDKASFCWYLNLNQPYSVALSNTSALTTILLVECASPIAWSHVGVGHEAAVSFFGLVMTLNFAGGTMDHCTWTRATLASSGQYITQYTDCSGFTCTNERVHALGGNRGNGVTGAQTLIRVADSTWTDCVVGGGRVLMATCTDLTFTDTTYYDHPATTTPTTNPQNAFDMSTNCVGITMDGLSFGGLAMCQPYTGILNIGAAGCSNIKLRNLGSAASPLDMGGASVNATWTRATTTMTITKVAHGLKTGDLIAVNIVSDVAPKAVTTTTATLWTVASAPTADTFTVTVTNAGAASGTMSYYPTMVGTLVTLAASAAANNVRIQRCYTPHLRTGFMSGDNSSKNIKVDNSWGSEWGVQLVPELNCSIRGLQSTPALTAQTSCYGTHWLDYWFAGVPANVAGVAWTRATTTATVTSADHGLRTGMVVLVTVTSSAAAIVLGLKTITATTDDAFTFTCLNAGSASGTLTFTPLVSSFAIVMNEATADTVSQYTIDAGTPGFTSAGGLYMPVINDQVTFETPDFIIGHTSFPAAEAVMAGGTIGNYDITYAIDQGAGYSSFKNLYYTRAGGGGSNGSTTVTMTSTTGVAAGDYVWGTNVAPLAKVVTVDSSTNITVDLANVGAVSGVLRFSQLPSETVTDASIGFKLKVRIKTTTTNATAITSLYVQTDTTVASRAFQYVLDPVPISVTCLDAATGDPVVGARVYLTADSGGPATPGDVLFNAVTDGNGVATDPAFDYQGAQPITGRARKGTTAPLYKTALTAGTITELGLSSTVFMVSDA